MEQASDEAYAALKDVVYRHLFSFDIPLGNGQVNWSCLKVMYIELSVICTISVSVSFTSILAFVLS